MEKDLQSQATPERCLELTLRFIEIQLKFLEMLPEKKEVHLLQDKLAKCVAILQEPEVPSPVTPPVTEFPIELPDNCLPYKIGVVARAVIPEIFKRGKITEDDVRYLTSEQATADFVCCRLPFIRPYISGKPSEYCDKAGRRRYYPIDHVCLKFQRKKYYLCSQLKPENNKFENLLSWIEKHGISQEELIQLCKRFTEKGKPSKTEGKPNSGQSIKGSDDSPQAPSSEKDSFSSEQREAIESYLDGKSEEMKKIIAILHKNGITRFKDFVQIWHERFGDKSYWSLLADRLERSYVATWSDFPKIERIGEKERKNILKSFMGNESKR